MFNKLKHLQEKAYFPHREINLSRPKNLSSTDFGSLSSKHPIVFFRLEPYLKGECMNLKAKPHKQSLVVEDYNYLWVLGLCRFVSEDFNTTIKR